MPIKLTSAEAQAAGYKKLDKGALVDRSKGITIENSQVGYICYIGPCEPGTGARTVCYLTDTGACDDCYLEDDPQCTDLSAAVTAIGVTKADKIEALPGASGVVPIVTPNTVSTSPLATPSALRCLNFFAAGSGRVGIRNNCNECKVAVVMWQNVGVYYYRVEAFSQIIVDVVSSFGELIGENPC